MTAIVIVSHSKKFAEGLAELIKLMAEDMPVIAAGGLYDGGIGTSYELIREAVLSVYSDDGVLIIADMGSSVMTSEMVIEDLAFEGMDKIKLSELHPAEAVAEAAVSLQSGADIFGNIREEAKDEEIKDSEKPKSDEASFSWVIRDQGGLHARPAAELIKLLKGFESSMYVYTSNNHACAKSLPELLSLRAVCGTELTFKAEGSDALKACKAAYAFVNERL